MNFKAYFHRILFYAFNTPWRAMQIYWLHTGRAFTDRSVICGGKLVSPCNQNALQSPLDIHRGLVQGLKSEDAQVYYINGICTNHTAHSTSLEITYST